MSLKRNILANYVGQFYTMLIGIAMVPVYIKYMGTEAYGLVGFYTMLQAWFTLLDMGLTPTMARETARYQGGAADGLKLWQLLRALEVIFIGIAALGSIAIIAGSQLIASKWLKVEQLPLIEVQHAIMLMAVIISLRWICGLYRGAINGFERLIWLNAFNIFIATLRFVLIIPYLIYVGATPTKFFFYQLIVAIIEITILVVQSYRLMPKTAVNQRLSWKWDPLRKVFKFSLSMSFISMVWVLVTQADKLILSNLLTLSDYAYFTLAVMVASGIMVLSGPVSGALLPRLTKLNAAGDEIGLIRLYRNATQMVNVVAIPAAVVLAFFSEQVLWAWTGDSGIAHKAAPVLTLYALGNGILALAAFPFYLQYAKGDLKLHLIGNALFVAIFIPLLIWATREYGMVGAGYAWIAANLLPFLIWLPIVHRRFAKGLHLPWFLYDVCSVMALPIASAFILQHIIVWPETRIMVTVYLLMVGSVLCVIAALSSPWMRNSIQRIVLERFAV